MNHDYKDVRAQTDSIMIVGDCNNETRMNARRGVRIDTPTGPTTRPAWIAAILPNGFPDRVQLEAASCLSIGPAGLILDVSSTPSLPVGRWAVGVAVGTEWQFVAVEVIHPDTADGTAVNAAFLLDDRDFFHVRNRIPHCHPQTRRFQTSLSTAALNRWADLGVLQPQFHDRVLLCPKCDAAPSIRAGCQVCGSAQITNDTCIHHFNCGHIGKASDFDQADRLECPQCHALNLVVGADYEYQKNSHTCQDCGWQDENLEFVLQCLACELRFPIHQAVEQELTAYHVNRLDPLAAFPAT